MDTYRLHLYLYLDFHGVLNVGILKVKNELFILGKYPYTYSKRYDVRILGDYIYSGGDIGSRFIIDNNCSIKKVNPKHNRLVIKTKKYHMVKGTKLSLYDAIEIVEKYNEKKLKLF